MNNNPPRATAARDHSSFGSYSHQSPESLDKWLNIAARHVKDKEFEGATLEAMNDDKITQLRSLLKYVESTNWMFSSP